MSDDESFDGLIARTTTAVLGSDGNRLSGSLVMALAPACWATGAVVRARAAEAQPPLIPPMEYEKRIRATEMVDALSPDMMSSQDENKNYHLCCAWTLRGCSGVDIFSGIYRIHPANIRAIDDRRVRTSS